MATKKITKSAKTGKIVSKKEAKESPDTTYETSVEVPDVVEQYQPTLGEICLVGNGVGADFVGSFIAPGILVEHSILNGCRHEEEVDWLTSMTFSPLTKQEVFERIY